MTSNFSPPGESPEPWKAQKLYRDEADVADRLPSQVAMKLRQLRDAAESARAVASVPYLAMKETNSQRTQLASRISDLTNKRRLPETDPLVVSERETLAKLTEKSRALAAEADARRERAGQLSRLVTSLEGYIGSIPRNRAIEIAPPVAVPKLSRPVAEMVDDIRERLDKHRREMREAVNAPIHSTEAKKRAASFIGALAANGEPDVLGLIEGGQIEFPTKTFSPMAVAGRGVAGLTEGRPEVDTLGLFCWLHRDALVAALHREIDKNSDDANALSEPERGAKIKKARAALLADERLEESLISLAETQGLVILRREDADARAILGFSDAMPEPRGDA